MATQCFVFRLKEEVNNDNLPRFNALNARITNSAGNPYIFRCEGITNAEIIGDGYFTNSTDTQNLGKNLTKDPDDRIYVHVTTAPIQVLLLDMNKATGTIQIGTRTSGKMNTNRYIEFDVAEAFQNDEPYDSVNFGAENQATQNTGVSCSGDITNLKVLAKSVYFTGCAQIYGNASTFIENNYDGDSNNLTLLNIYATPSSKITFNTSCLQGKNKLYIAPPTGSNCKGDIKWFGDTRCRNCNDSTGMSNTLTGSVNELVEHLVAQGRTDYFYFMLNNNRWQNVTYTYNDNGSPVTRTLRQIWELYKAENPEATQVALKLTWSGTGENIVINHEFLTSEPLPRYNPL